MNPGGRAAGRSRARSFWRARLRSRRELRSGQDARREKRRNRARYFDSIESSVNARVARPISRGQARRLDPATRRFDRRAPQPVPFWRERRFERPPNRVVASDATPRSQKTRDVYRAGGRSTRARGPRRGTPRRALSAPSRPVAGVAGSARGPWRTASVAACACAAGTAPPPIVRGACARTSPAT